MISVVLMFASAAPGSYQLHWQLGGSRLSKTAPLSSVLFPGSLCLFEEAGSAGVFELRPNNSCVCSFFHLLGAIQEVSFNQSQNLVCFTRDG